MSRYITYQDQRLTVVTGHDHILGMFFQLYDKEWIGKTPEGEGLVYDWSEKFKEEINNTGITHETPAKTINKYIKKNNS